MEKAKDYIYYPMLVSSNPGEPLSLDENRTVWETFDRLPELNRSVLISHEMPDRIGELQKTLSLTDKQTAHLSFLVRAYYFGTSSLDELRTRLLELAQGNPKAWTLFQEKVLTVHPTLPEAGTDDRAAAPPVRPEAVQLPLLQALSKYPELASQQVTAEKIRIRSEREPVRPTLMHWLRYYRDELGIGYHDSVQRGQFLYRSENGRRLSPEERERINLVLKSVEDELPLAIDPERKAVLFPAFERGAAPAPAEKPPAPAAPRAMEERYRDLASPAPGPAFVQPAPKLSFSPAPKPLPTPAPAPPVRPKARILPPPIPSPVIAPATRSGTEGITPEPAFTQSPLRRSFFQKAASTAPLGNITFTTRHVLPAEEIGKSIPVPSPAPQAKAPDLPLKRSPFSIRPVSRS